MKTQPITLCRGKFPNQECAVFWADKHGTERQTTYGSREYVERIYEEDKGSDQGVDGKSLNGA